MARQAREATLDSDELGAVAHIHWFQFDGPNEVANGLALCSLHHKAFDLGAFTVETGGQIVVSAAVCGEGSQEAIVRHHNREVTVRPETDAERPALRFLDWHRTDVFREPAL